MYIIHCDDAAWLRPCGKAWEGFLKAVSTAEGSLKATIVPVPSGETLSALIHPLNGRATATLAL